jgi:hypothetical protein
MIAFTAEQTPKISKAVDFVHVSLGKRKKTWNLSS